MEYLITQYPRDPRAIGPPNIQYIEEYFVEFPRKKAATEIMNRLRHRSQRPTSDVLRSHASTRAVVYAD